MKTTIIFAVAVLLVHCAVVLADDDKGSYNRRAAETDMALFVELDRSGNGFLTRENTSGDMRLGTRFDDIDTNRDGIVTQQEMRTYIEQTYGVVPVAASPGPR